MHTIMTRPYFIRLYWYSIICYCRCMENSSYFAESFCMKHKKSCFGLTFNLQPYYIELTEDEIINFREFNIRWTFEVSSNCYCLFDGTVWIFFPTDKLQNTGMQSKNLPKTYLPETLFFPINSSRWRFSTCCYNMQKISCELLL